MSEKTPITPQGYQKLKDELKQLISVERPKIVNDIEEALAHGDLKENAEYHSAKEKQGMIEGRIQIINAAIADANVIDVSKINTDKVVFGATVTYEDTETEEEAVWQIVGQDEASISERKISILSPIAKALIGKKEGDVVLIQIPRGEIEVEITSIEYV